MFSVNNKLKYNLVVYSSTRELICSVLSNLDFFSELTKFRCAGISKSTSASTPFSDWLAGMEEFRGGRMPCPAVI